MSHCCLGLAPLSVASRSLRTLASPRRIPRQHRVVLPCCSPNLAVCVVFALVSVLMPRVPFARPRYFGDFGIRASRTQPRCLSGSFSGLRPTSLFATTSKRQADFQATPLCITPSPCQQRIRDRAPAGESVRHLLRWRLAGPPHGASLPHVDLKSTGESARSCSSAAAWCSYAARARHRLVRRIPHLSCVHLLL